MAQILRANKFEFVDGSRLGSVQVLYNNNLYNKHKVFSWKCKEKGCNSTLNINENIYKDDSQNMEPCEDFFGCTNTTQNYTALEIPSSNNLNSLFYNQISSSFSARAD